MIISFIQPTKKCRKIQGTFVERTPASPQNLRLLFVFEVEPDTLGGCGPDCFHMRLFFNMS